MSLSSSVHFVSLLFVYCSLCVDIDIYRITGITRSFESGMTGSQWLAIQEINNNTQLLANYKFNLKLKVYGDVDAINTALNGLFDILHESEGTSCSNQSIAPNNVFPIILGIARSSISTLIASVAGVNHLGLISGSATSVALSDTDKYPYFYRSTASDALQSKGLIFLCDTFNWNRIVVVYANDAYGLHLSLGVQQLGKLHSIDVTSIAIQYEDDITYLYAARQIKEIRKYIIILILTETTVENLLDIFDDEGLIGYPYYYLGVDSWIDSKHKQIGNKTKGFLGTMSWNINQFGLNQYDDDIRDVMNISYTKTYNLLNSWHYLYHNGYSDQLYIDTDNIQSFAFNGYDNMYSIAYAIDEIEKEYGVGSMINMLQNDSRKEIIIKLINDTIINKVSFIGTTGHIKYDSNGDRQNGLFSFGNIVDAAVGDINYVGYFLENKESFLSLNDTALFNLGIDSIKSKIDINAIVWPSYFTEKGIIPHSDIIVSKQIHGVINKSVLIAMFIFCGIFIIFILSGMIFIIYHRKNIIIKRSSWTMNSIMCIGCILSFITAILYGFDEEFIKSDQSDNTSMHILCTFRLYLIVIAFTITVMPLFLKTWRLVQIFNNLSSVTRIYDKQLYIYIIISIVIDIILLSIFILCEPYNRIYHNGDIVEMDALQHIQQIYGVCQFTDQYKLNLLFYFYAILILWKFGQLLFGIYCALNVARIHNDPNGNKNVLSRFVKFDETGAQLTSIILTFIILLISILFISVIPNDSSSVKYVIIVITILLIGMSVFLLNLLPRIIAVIKKDSKSNQKYNKSVEQQFRERLKKKLMKMDLSDFDLQNSTDLKNVSSHSAEQIDKNVPDIVNELASYVENNSTQ